MNEIVTIPAGTQLDEGHVALKDIQFKVERRGGVYNAKWVGQGIYGMPGVGLSIDDAIWKARGNLTRLLDWIDGDNVDARYANRGIGPALRACVGHRNGMVCDADPERVVLDGHLLEAGDGYEWSSLFISGMDLAEALAAALRVDKLDNSYIQIWGHDDEGNDIDADSTICTIANEDDRPSRHERLFYDFGRVRITVERLGGEE